jgi:hypothetical protein|eukprot:SAG25_NODE_568_length_6882_cov_518.788589_8_plen_95_part_00
MGQGTQGGASERQAERVESGSAAQAGRAEGGEGCRARWDTTPYGAPHRARDGAHRGMRKGACVEGKWGLGGCLGGGGWGVDRLSEDNLSRCTNL